MYLLAGDGGSDWVAIAGVTIALVALIQPWAYALWRLVYRPGILEVLIAGRPEIGFSEWGPTIGLEGALVARHRDFVVEDIQLMLRFNETDAKHKFVWAAFRSLKMKLSVDSPLEIELPVGFVASQSQPHRFNIFFQDKTTADKITEPLRELHREFGKTLEKSGLLGEGAHQEGTIQYEAARVHFQQEWAKNGAKTTAYTRVGESFYWKPGRYTVTIVVSCRWPKRKFTAHFDFNLSEEDCDRLKFNTIVLTSVGETLDGTSVQFNFAHPERGEVVQNQGKQDRGSSVA